MIIFTHSGKYLSVFPIISGAVKPINTELFTFKSMITRADQYITSASTQRMMMSLAAGNEVEIG